MGRMHNWKALLLFTFSQSPPALDDHRVFMKACVKQTVCRAVPKYVHKTFELARTRIIG